MKRRTFLIAGIATVAAASVPFIYHYKIRHEYFDSGDPLTTPDVLAHFCDEKAIQEIGRMYISRTPAENSAQTLSHLLESDGQGRRMNRLGDREMAGFLARKAKADFASGNVVYINGWMLSQTEARQCALFSLSSKRK